MPNDLLQVRSEPETPLSTVAWSIRAETLNEDNRSVDAAIATENPVEVWDWRTGEVVDEILRADGADLPRQLPLLETHNRWSLRSVLGSARNIRKDGGAIVATLVFARNDPAADSAWNKVRQGHLTDISVGYRVKDRTVIPPGQSAKVGGREYEAKTRPTHVATDWKPREASIVPIGADEAAKMRESFPIPLTKGCTMPPELRAYLVSVGLPTDASDDDAKRFLAGLTGDQRAEADRIQNRDPSTPGDNQTRTPATTPTPATAPAAGRTEPASTPASANTPADPQTVAREAVAAERGRVAEIRQLAGDDVPPETVDQAIREGWPTDQSATAFLAAIRAGRPTGPAIHVHDRGAILSNRTLACGMMAGHGLNPTRHRGHDGSSTPTRAAVFTEEEATRGDEFRSLSAVDLCRECAAIDNGGRYIRDPREAFRAAVSGASLSYVFSTNVYASLIAAWESVGDTTVGWTDEEDVANFLQQEAIDLLADSALTRLPPGAEADHATASDTRETYKIARYARQFRIDEQDVLDDRLSALMRMPAEMGEAARNVRPDLVYALLLENPTLAADSVAVFHAASHSNLGSDALGADALKTAITAMGSQRRNNRVLNIRPRFLIVPAALEWTARELTAATALAKLFADSSDPWYPQLNLLAQEGIRTVPDDRIGATGVIDPRNATARTGSATNWFLAMGGSRSIRVAFLRGTNRSPVLRSFTLDKGSWGIGWDVNLDIGAAFMDYRGFYKSDGTA